MGISDEKHRVLVVDDDQRLRRFLQRFLASEGYAVTSAEDGRAMRRAMADEDFDLVILDLTFPAGEDGVSLARSLRAQHDLPLIMLSGKNSTCCRGGQVPKHPTDRVKCALKWGTLWATEEEVHDTCVESVLQNAVCALRHASLSDGVPSVDANVMHL